MMSKTTPTNMDDVIDSRDIIERIEELEMRGPNDRRVEYRNDPTWETPEEDKEELDELDALYALREDGEASPDWSYGETLIRDSYFKDYAQELAEDCCEMPKSDQWPQRCIDWEQAARELQQDYMSVDFDGIDYWIRA